MNILFITSRPSSKGGIGNWVRIIQKLLPMYENVCAQYLYPASFSDSSKPAMERNIVERVIGGLFLMLRANQELKAKLRQQKDIIVHVTSSGSLSVVRDLLFLHTCKKRNIPFVFHIRFGRIPELIYENNLEWKIIKHIISESDVTISIDKKTYSALRNNLSNKSIKLIPNLYDYEMIEKVHMNPTVVSKEILFVGWVIKNKGVEELLCAWKEISKKYSEYSLRIVGPVKSEYLEYLKNTYTQVRVEFTGSLEHDEVINLIRQSSVFVLPSYTEGFPNVVLEAMALGKPIIATQVGAIPEMLEDCGILIDKGNATQLKEALEKILADSTYAKQLSELSHAKAIRAYSSQVVINEYIVAWEECLRNH